MGINKRFKRRRYVLICRSFLIGYYDKIKDAEAALNQLSDEDIAECVLVRTDYIATMLERNMEIRL